MLDAGGRVTSTVAHCVVGPSAILEVASSLSPRERDFFRALLILTVPHGWKLAIIHHEKGLTHKPKRPASSMNVKLR